MFKNFWTIQRLCLLTCAFIFLLIGFICFGTYGIPAIIKNEIHKQTQLKNETDQWNRFETLPFPLKFGVRFFNILNVSDIKQKNDVTFQLQETEPYIYNLNISKRNITANDSEDSLTYSRSMSLTYDSTQPYSDKANVTIVNPILLSSLQLTSTVDRIALAGCLDKIFTNETNKLFLTKTVEELVIKGIEFAFEEHYIGVACGLIRNKAFDIVKDVRPIEIVGRPPNRFLRFSMFKWKTDGYIKRSQDVPSPDGVYTVGRGINDMSQLGQIIRWNNFQEISIWGNKMSLNNDTCRRVRGTDSTIFSPQLKEGGSLDNFNTDICRIVTINYKKKQIFHNIQGYRYEAPPETFWNATKNSENDCFCSKSISNEFGKEDCYLDGVFDFKPCLGAPILVSFPHFKDADAKYRRNIHFMNNDDDLSKFQTFLLVEPNTGIPLQGRIRVQMNVVLRPEFLLDDILPSNNKSRGIIPILWLEESFDLPENFIQMLNNQYFSKVALATGLKYGGIAVIAVLSAMSVFFLIRKKYVRPKNVNCVN